MSYDDEATRAMLRKMLARAGQRCSEAANGRQALDFLGENCPDLILLDLMMPVMDGFEFLETVAQPRALSAVISLNASKAPARLVAAAGWLRPANKHRSSGQASATG